MKRTRMLSILLAVLLVFSFSAAVLAAEPMTITVETKADAVQVGDEVSLAVSIAGNPGFTNYEWTLEYDEALLEVKKVENKLNGLFETREEIGRVNIGLIAANPISEDGTAFVVTFLVKQGAAEGLSEVKISSKKLANVPEKVEAIDAQYSAGGVTIASTTGGSTTGGSTTGGSTTGGSTTGGSTTGGSTTGGSTTGGSTTGSGRMVELVGGNSSATYKVTGSTLNVQNDTACVVLYTTDGGETYTKLAATANEAGGYDFDLTNVPANAVIKIAIQGDFNMDGSVDALDAVMVNRAAAGLLPHNELQSQIGHVGGSDALDGLDALLINRSAAGKYTIAW